MNEWKALVKEALNQGITPEQITSFLTKTKEVTK